MYSYLHKTFSYSQKQGKNMARTQCVLNILTGMQSPRNHCQQKQTSDSVLRRYNKHSSFQQLPDTSTICCNEILVWNKSDVSLNAETCTPSTVK